METEDQSCKEERFFTKDDEIHANSWQFCAVNERMDWLKHNRGIEIKSSSIFHEPEDKQLAALGVKFGWAVQDGSTNRAESILNELDGFIPTQDKQQ